MPRVSAKLEKLTYLGVVMMDEALCSALEIDEFRRAVRGLEEKGEEDRFQFDDGIVHEVEDSHEDSISKSGQENSTNVEARVRLLKTCFCLFCSLFAVQKQLYD